MTAEVPPEPGMILWHYILTLAWKQDHDDDVMQQTEGTLWLHDWVTTGEVLARLRDEAGIPEGAAGLGAVLFFRLEPAVIGEYRTRRSPVPEFITPLPAGRVESAVRTALAQEIRPGSDGQGDGSIEGET